MRKTMMMMALATGLTATAWTQDTVLYTNAHVGFIYPLSTNGVNAPKYVNRFSIHALGGVSRAEEAFCVAGVASVVRQNAKGFIGSGIANVVLGNGKGCQVAGNVNYNGGNFSGFQGSGTVNYNGGDLRGAQVAGCVNLARNINGFQGAGFANIGLHKVTGAQVAGFINAADTAEVQVAGFVNVTHSTNTQVAGFINAAKDVKGVQVAGFINVARKVKGLQIAGFINVADSSDCPIGLINIVRNGEQAIGLTVNEIGTTMATFRSGGRILYGIIGIGGNFTGDYNAMASQAGLGMHIPLSRNFRINTELTATGLYDFYGNGDLRSAVTVMPSLRFGRLEVFGGPSFSYTATNDAQGLGRVGYSVWSRDRRYYSQDLSIGFEGGVQLHLNGHGKPARKIVPAVN